MSNLNVSEETPGLVRLALPKGRMQAGVLSLLSDAGVAVQASARSYRPRLSLDGFDTKTLKPQNIVEMLALGSRDVGFAGADWVDELGVDLEPLVDTGLDPVQIVAAAPEALLVDGRLPRRRLVVASEYETLTKRWIEQRELDAVFVRSYGATEVFPPEDADCIVDNSASGATLRDNGLLVADELMRSSTRLYANPKALSDPSKRARIDDLVLLIESVLQARRRAMVEVNVTAEGLAKVIEVLPCMREPTIAELSRGAGYAVKAAVPRDVLPKTIAALKEAGGCDIVVTPIAQIVA